MYARVVPLLRLPRSMGVFDYRIPEGSSVMKGMRVHIPFRTAQIAGIVIDVEAHTRYPQDKIKSITAIPSAHPLLPEPLLRTAAVIAEDNYTSPATLFKSMVPDFPKSKPPELSPVPRRKTGSVPLPEIDPALQEHGVLLTYTDDRSLIAWYRAAIDSYVPSDRSVLIICPTVERVKALHAALTDSVPFHQALKTTERRTTFLAIRNATGSIVVVGTRSALFAPVTRLGLIIVDNEDHDEHAQDMPNPRYDARRAAVQRAHAENAAIVLTSRFPSIVARTTYPIAAIIGAPHAPSLDLVDLDDHHRSGSFSILTDKSLQRIAGTLKKNEPVLVVHHHHDLYGSIQCPDCGYVPLCATCTVAYHHEHHELVCRHCATTEPIPATCPRCHGAGLQGRGKGIAFVLRELTHAGIRAKEWGVSEVIDRNTAYVSTVAMLRSLPEQAFGCTVMTRYDSMLSIPRFDADERARRAVNLLISRTTQEGRAIVQASSRQHRAIRALNDPEWRERTLLERKRFGYPPAWKITLLRRRDDAQDSRVAEEVYRALDPSNPEYQITPPQRSPGRSKRDTGGTVIVIRHTKQLPAAVRTLLAALDEGWSITMNPIDLR